ncbi:SPOR domain-containing protein [Acidithiobacillus sp. M4-SHS-6]|uniref:SPOR domain-containing protein n=1 Tax=Acidithiobacillus sp. M4-SHS-6 TaxID=3383024 RepID=UPI0039BE588D
MDDSDTLVSQTPVVSKQRHRLGILPFIMLVLIVLLAASFLWESWSTDYPGKHMAPGSGASSVFLTLPKTIVATTGSAMDPAVPVAIARSLVITVAKHSSLPHSANGTTAVPAPVKPVKIAHSCQQAGWYVQLGAFGKASMAENLRQQVTQLGVKACVGTLSVNHLFRVLVGPQSSKNEAGMAAMGIGKKSGQKGAYPQYWSPE